MLFRFATLTTFAVVFAAPGSVFAQTYPTGGVSGIQVVSLSNGSVTVVSTYYEENGAAHGLTSQTLDAFGSTGDHSHLAGSPPGWRFGDAVAKSEVAPCSSILPSNSSWLSPFARWSWPLRTSQPSRASPAASTAAMAGRVAISA